VGILEAAGVRYAVEVDPAAPPSQVVLEWADGHDLLAIGAPASSLLTGAFVKGVGETALDAFTTPLLIARAAAPPDSFARRILVASDGMDGSDELVEMAGRLARARGAELTLLHARGSGSSARSHRIEEQSRRLGREVEGPVELRMGPGTAHTMIVDSAAELGASLVVMGSRRLAGLRALGSVSRRVAHHGHCSVLLVPPLSRRLSGAGLSPRPAPC
jgi:nucleotide-binding universal stress UspA family protein